jgi:hypothetical protein
MDKKINSTLLPMSSNPKSTHNLKISIKEYKPSNIQ